MECEITVHATLFTDDSLMKKKKKRHFRESEKDNMDWEVKRDPHHRG